MRMDIEMVSAMCDGQNYSKSNTVAYLFVFKTGNQVIRSKTDKELHEIVQVLKYRLADVQHMFRLQSQHKEPPIVATIDKHKFWDDLKRAVMASQP